MFKVLNRSTYGWVEFIEALPCKDKEEPTRYYQRSGALLCLAYVLWATDLHYENIIAHGEHPVLIDLETLMHPWVRDTEGVKVAKNAQYLANEQLSHSVLYTGLLPRWQFSLESQSYDSSGLGGVGQQKTSFRVQKWQNINTDNMAFSYDYEKTKLQTNTPSLNGVNLSLSLYIKEIFEGFKLMYRFLMEHLKKFIPRYSFNISRSSAYTLCFSLYKDLQFYFRKNTRGTISARRYRSKYSA